jgi:hypothetical protein
MKQAWANCKAMFKRALGENGIYLLCLILGVKILFDATFSMLVWLQLDRLSTNQHLIADAHNRRLEEDRKHYDETVQELQDQLDKAESSRQRFQHDALINQQEVLNKINASAYSLQLQHKTITDLMADLHNFIAVRGYDPITAQEFDRWVSETNAILKASHLALQLPPRPPHDDPRLRDVRNMAKPLPPLKNR